MPVERLVDAAADFCRIGGVDADVPLCKGQHRFDPNLGDAAQSGSGCNVMMGTMQNHRPGVI